MNAVAAQQEVAGRYKITKIHTGHYSEVRFCLSGADGKLFIPQTVGRVWEYQAVNNGWCAMDTVIESKRYGLLRYAPFKSRYTKLMILAEGEVYLPTEKTGRALFLKTLPE